MAIPGFLKRKRGSGEKGGRPGPKKRERPTEGHWYGGGNAKKHITHGELGHTKNGNVEEE